MSPFGFNDYKDEIEMISFGKRLPSALYLYLESAELLPPRLAEVVASAVADLGIEFNVLKLRTDAFKVSLLHYPKFLTDPHPALEKSVVVDLAIGSPKHFDYRGKINPPILHRKETFLPPGHPKIELFSKLTAEEVEAGLYEETHTIGFRENWKRLLAEKGFELVGHSLRKLDPSDSKATEEVHNARSKIDRARTALSRNDLSVPAKQLLANGVLRKTDRFFDYGCGLGTDVKGLGELGYEAEGWDPAYSPEAPLREADVVNLGFVLNVIEDPAERVQTLISAWALTGRVLAVTTLVEGRETYTRAEKFGDGYVTSVNTFQKYFGQEELHALIHDALDAEVVPVQLGMFYAFRHFTDYQDYLSARARRSIDWESISRKLRFLRPPRPSLQRTYLEHRELLDEFWQSTLELGRIPHVDEFERLEDVRKSCRSVPRALQIFLDDDGERELDAARIRRREDLLVYLAAGEFEKRRTPYSRLSPGLKRDLKCFFGSYPSACGEARELLFASGDPDELEMIIETLGYGQNDSAEQQFTIHRCLMPKLPPSLRIFIECGARLYGDPSQADLIKIHYGTGKLTFLHYENFDEATLPVIQTRIKIDLGRLFVNVFDYTKIEKSQILFFKERFLPGDYPGRESMERYSTRLRKLGVTEEYLGSNDRNAPSLEEFEAVLDRVGLTRGLSRKGKGRAEGEG